MNTLECKSIIHKIGPLCRSACTLDYYNNDIYLIGGNKSAQDSDVWIYSIQNNSWVNIPVNIDEFKVNATSHKTVVYKHYIILFGGMGYN